MPTIPMKEIRIPSQLEREERERRGIRPPKSLTAVFIRTSYTALIIAIISFFALTAISIAGLAIYAAFAHTTPDFANAYRNVGLPGAIGLFVGVWTYSFVIFRRQYKRAKRASAFS